MHNLRVKSALTGAALLFVGAQPVRAQNNAALINSYLGAGTSAVNMLGSLAAQQQARELQREQFQQMQNERAFQQDQVAAQSHHCQPGFSGALIVHTDGTHELICEQRR